MKEKAVITLRIEKELLEKIDKSADAEERDRTKQIIYIIKKYYDLQENK